MKFTRLEDELESLDPEREATKRESLNRQQVLEQAKQHMIQLEVRRKDLDNDVEAKKEQIQKYAQQQLETRKNEEYTALGREIDHVKETISKIEDEELELMEEIDAYKPKIEEAKVVAHEGGAGKVLGVAGSGRASFVEITASRVACHHVLVVQGKV